MNLRHQFEFVLLGAVWGASFLFMRVSVPEFGPLPLMLVRCAIGAAVLLPIAAARHGGWRLFEDARNHGLRLLFAGTMNSAIPFVMFGFAALSLSAGFSSILNATAPIFGAIVGYFWLRDRLAAWRVGGLLIGISGVAVLSWDKASFRGGDAGGWAVLACLVATFCYGVAGTFAKRRLANIDPLVVAAGSQLGAMLVLLVPGLAQWPAATPSAGAWIGALALGSACTGLAFVLFFRLIAKVSSSAALSVTFLIPLFGVLWGWLFLAETVDASMLTGGAIVVLGTMLSTGVLGPQGPTENPSRRSEEPRV
jgi:drug/metabolite transporter (DMT)-like permease